MSNVRTVTMRWTGGQSFEGGRPDGPSIVLDGGQAAGPSPMEGLLASLASCAGIDVVLILEKMRQPPATLAIEVAGTRREAEPKRFVSVSLVFSVTGAGLDVAKVERAVQLSVEKYCSVLATLAPDLVVDWRAEVGAA